jgi:ribonuclease P protein component
MDTEEKGKAGFCFPRNERLCANSSILRVLKFGRSVNCPGMKMAYLENGLGINRAAFTLRRKFGIAVQRNRAKRHARESYRSIKAGIVVGFDLVFLLFPGRYFLSDRRIQMETLLRGARFLRSIS